MKKYVLDSSVVIKWFFCEIYTDQALELKREFDEGRARFIIPQLFYSEIANTFRQKAKAKDCSYEQGMEGLNYLEKFPFVVRSDRELFDLAYENATLYNLSAYDASYVSLAEIYVSPLITADERMLKACKGRFDFIEHISDIKLNGASFDLS